jgi:hypothetical protein
VVLGAIAQGAPLRVAHFVGQQQDGVDDAPDDCTDSAGDETDEELGDTESCVAEIYPADADKSEKSKELQQASDNFRLVGQWLTSNGGG